MGVLALLHNAQIDQAIATNLRAPMILTRQVVRQMRMREGGGSIVNISSVVGVRGYRGMTLYGATKGGLDAMTRARPASGDMEDPGQFRCTRLPPQEMSAPLKDEQLGKILRRTPLQRLGTPEDVVGPVRFLLSDESAFVTGQLLVVDGGITV